MSLSADSIESAHAPANQQLLTLDGGTFTYIYAVIAFVLVIVLLQHYLDFFALGTSNLKHGKKHSNFGLGLLASARYLLDPTPYYLFLTRNCPIKTQGLVIKRVILLIIISFIYRSLRRDVDWDNWDPQSWYSVFGHATAFVLVININYLVDLTFVLQFLFADNEIHRAVVVDRFFPPESFSYHMPKKLKKGEKFSTVPVDACGMRGYFTHKDFDLSRATPDPSSQHRNAAARRSAAIQCCDAWIKRYGLVKYDEQMSRRSCRQESYGIRALMDGKDASSYTTEHLCMNEIPDDDKRHRVVTHIDTLGKKTLDQTHRCLSDGNIHMIYTFNPDCLAGKADECTFSYEKGKMIYKSSAVEPYVDNTPNFEDDCLTTFRYDWFIPRSVKLITIALLIYAILRQSEMDAFNENLQNWYVCYMAPYYYEIRINYATWFHFTGFAPDAGWGNLWFWWPQWVWQVFFIRIPYFWPASARTWSLYGLDGFLLGMWAALLLFGCRTFVCYAHKVIRLDVGEQRSIVVIIPNARFVGLSAHLRRFLTDKAFKFRKPNSVVCENGTTFLYEHYTDQGGYSVSYEGAPTSYFVPNPALDLAKSLSTAKHTTSVANLRLTGKQDLSLLMDRTECAAAIAIARTKSMPSFSVNYAASPVPVILRNDPGVEPRAPLVTACMTPIVENAAFCHATSDKAYEDLARRRVEEPHKGGIVPLTQELADYVGEFAELVKIEVNDLDMDRQPTERITKKVETSTEKCQEKIGFRRNLKLDLLPEDEYIETRKPNQLKKFYEVETHYDVEVLDTCKGLKKREIMADPSKAARGIATFSPEQQVLGGRISLAYAKALKSCGWLGSGLTPKGITDAVCRVCAAAHKVLETDFKAQDAKIDDTKRVIELHLLKFFFEQDLHDLLDLWHFSDYQGAVRYGPVVQAFDGSRGSGSPFTTMGNTPLTALFAFIAFRLQGLGPKEAYASLGIYSGDDGLSPNLSEEAATKSGALLGFEVKSKNNVKNIGFLGRIYFDPINGERWSITDPAKIGRLHTSLLDFTDLQPREAMVMKAMCFQATDKYSDFWGPWSTKVIKDAGYKQTQILKERVLAFPSLHPYFAITALQVNETFETKEGVFNEYISEHFEGDFDWALFADWLDSSTNPNRNACCPTLAILPLDMVKMQAQAPVTIAYGGVADHSQHLTFESEEVAEPKRRKHYKADSSSVSSNSSESESSTPSGTSGGRSRPYSALPAVFRLPKKSSKPARDERIKVLRQLSGHDRDFLAEFRAAKHDPKADPEINASRYAVRLEVMHDAADKLAVSDVPPRAK